MKNQVKTPQLKLSRPGSFTPSVVLIVLVLGVGLLLVALPVRAINCSYWIQQYNESQGEHVAARQLVQKADALTSASRQDLHATVNWLVTVFYPTMMKYYNNGYVAVPQFMSSQEMRDLVNVIPPSNRDFSMPGTSAAVARIETQLKANDLNDTATFQRLLATYEFIDRYAKNLRSGRITEQEAYSNILSSMMLLKMSESQELISKLIEIEAVGMTLDRRGNR